MNQINLNNKPQIKIYPSRLNKDNKGAVDWYCQNLIAYGCFSYIVIIDPIHLNILQTLDEHKCHVSIVKFSNDISFSSSTFLSQHQQSQQQSQQQSNSGGGGLNNSTGISSNTSIQNNLVRLASGDINGNIIIWNVLDATVLFNLSYHTDIATTPNKQSQSQKDKDNSKDNSISDLCWHPEDPDLLLSLHVGFLTLWNVNSGVKIWKRDIPDGFSGYSIQFDPFKSTRILLSTSFGCIYSIDELSANHLPLLEFKYRIYSKHNNPILNRDQLQLSNQWAQHNNSNNNNNSNSNNSSNNTSNNNSGNNNNINNSGNNTSTTSLLHHQHHHQNNLQHIHLDFLQMKFSPSSKNIIYYLLHRELFIYDSNTNQLFGSLVLDRNKTNFVNILLCKDNPNLMFSLHEDGSFTSWNKRMINDGIGGNNNNNFNYEQICTSDLSHYLKKSKKKNQQIYSIINGPHVFQTSVFSISGDGCMWKWDFISDVTVAGSANLYQPKLQSTLNNTPLNGVVKLAVSSFNESISSPTSSLSVYPFYNRSSISLIAIGTSHGTIQIVNMSTMKIQKEIYIWNRPIYGIRWLSPGRVLCFSFEEQDKGNYLNFITSVDFRSGRVKEFRKVSGSEPSPIKGIRLSYSRKFLVILLKDRPFELWETKRFTCLRSFKPFVNIIGLEWLPPTSDCEVELSSDGSKYEAKEQFTFLLLDGTVKQCTIELNSVTLSDLHADLGPLQTCLASKREYLVSGDVNGNIHSWNGLKKKLHSFSTHRGSIKKIKFSPLPASNEVFVLFSNGEFGIWDLNLNQRIAIGSHLLEGRDVKVVDFEWLTDSNPLIVTIDNSLRVLDSTLTISNSKFSFSSSIASSIYSNDQSQTTGSGNGGYLYSPILLPTIQWIQLKNLLLNYKILLFSSEYNGSNGSGGNSVDLNRSFDSTLIIKDNNEKNSKLLSFIDDKLISIISPTLDNDDIIDGDIENDSGNCNFTYKCNGIGLAESNLTVSQYFGDTKEIEFWRLVIYSISKFKLKNGDNFSGVSGFYDNDLIEFYNSLPSLPSIPMVNDHGSNSGSGISNSTNTNSALNNSNTTILSPQIQLSTNNNNIVNLNSPTLNVSPQTQTNNNVSNISPPFISTTPTTTTTTTTTAPSTASSILKKPLVSFFGFGQKSAPPTPTPTPVQIPIQSIQQPQLSLSSSNSNITTSSIPINNNNNSNNNNLNNNQSPNLIVSSQISPPTTPSKNILSTSASGILPLLQNLQQSQQQPTPISPIQPMAVVQNPLSHSYSSVAAQLNQSTIELGISNNSAGSDTPLNLSTIVDNGTTNASTNLPNYYDLLLDPHNLRSIELEKTDCYEKKKPDNELTKKLIEKNIMLGRNSKAVNLLLDTTPDHPDFFNRAMKACVISASISQEYYQNTTRLIAENLIAIGKLDEGVQFLCLIGKTMEACKYLQSCDRWYDAAILSKTNLSEDEHFIVFRSWVIHLLNSSGFGLHSSNGISGGSGKQSKPQNITLAINLLLSIGDFKSVIQILYETQQYDLASLLIDCCIENKLFTIPNFTTDDQNSELNNMDNSISIYSTNNGGSGSGISGSGSNSLSSSSGITFKFNQLVQVIFKEYGNLLHQLGNLHSSFYYWRKSGKKLNLNNTLL